MAINTDLLIAAPILQDSFVDKDGTPMAGGVITCYQDNSRTTLKNWYYQSGLPGNYTYIKLPNPLTLSAAGTICDIGGVDTIPFFYPYSEIDQNTKQPYYITIVNHDQTNQITRANFPFIADETNEPGSGSQDNYVINNRFWRNVGTVNATNLLDTVVCPGQHDGFSSPDVHFVKNVTGGQDTITFTKFPLTTTPILNGDITPEFYINHVCSNSASGETQKAYQFPISLHVNTLASVPFTFTIQGQNLSGTAPGQNTINIYILQNTGTGTVSPAPFLVGSIALNSAWQKYEISGVFPSTAGLTLGNGGDDALYLLVQMPLNINCSINFTLPSIYLTSDSPTNSFHTYDEIDAVINSPRTGDLRTSINSFYPYGWLPMNDGTIGNASSGSTTRADSDTWQLYNLLWTLAQPYDTGSNLNQICQIFTSAGAATNYGSTAIADFNANKSLALTKMMGRVMMGMVPVGALLSSVWSEVITASNSAGNILFTTTTTVGMFTGQPITFTTTGTLPGGIVANRVYFVTNINDGGANTFQVSSTYAGALAYTGLIAWSSAGSNSRLVLDVPGSTTGQGMHVQLQTELAAHAHTGTVALNSDGGSGVSTPGAALQLTNNNRALTINSTGDSYPFNIVQPGVFYNIFIKQ